MGDLFGEIYCWFEDLFGHNLAEHLWGYNCETQSYNDSNSFWGVGLITLFISLFMVLTYYYIINHPRFNRWWNWLIALGVTGVINMLIGYFWTVTDYLDGNIGDCLMYARDEEGNILSTHIFESDCWMFGVTNMIISIGFFVVFTFIFKWWSANCKNSPCL